MAAKKKKKKNVIPANIPLSELYVRKLMAGFVVLSFLVITICVLRTEASIYYQVMYITFDSMLVYMVARMVQSIVTKILRSYEEMNNGQI